ncbi:MAG: EscU/YscU/HrcU family type III secretion system export apparatus switch protein [Bacilli bacterium]
MKKKDSVPLKAVALHYSQNKNAPVIVAKGSGTVAEKILQTATDNKVPIQHDASLVEILSKLELNEEIPAELYQVVAEVLSVVYRADQHLGRFR